MPTLRFRKLMALAFTSLSLFAPVNTQIAMAAQEPDLAVELASKPDAANPRRVIFKVTNKSPFASVATTASVKTVYTGPRSPFLQLFPPPTNIKEGIVIDQLGPGQSTTFTYTLAGDCDGHELDVLVLPARSQSGQVEINLSNNGLASLKLCESTQNIASTQVGPDELIDYGGCGGCPSAKQGASTQVGPDELIDYGGCGGCPSAQKGASTQAGPDELIDYGGCSGCPSAQKGPGTQAGPDELIDYGGCACEPAPLPAIAIDPRGARCTQFFRDLRRGRFLSPRDDAISMECNDLTGWTAYCASRDAFITLTYGPNGSVNGQSCAPFSHPESAGEEFEHLATGIAEGVGDAFTAAAPFMTPVVSGLACVNGVLYSCAILALDVADSLGAGPPAGVARDALNIAHQVSTCADGDVVACAAVGQKGALAAGLDIPAADVTQVALFVEKCSRNDFAACAKLGKAAAQTAGVPTNLAGNLADAEDCLSSANGDACAALGKSASKLAGLLGTISDGTANGQKCANGDDKACRALGHAVASAAR